MEVQKETWTDFNKRLDLVIISNSRQACQNILRFLDHVFFFLLRNQTSNIQRIISAVAASA